MVGADLKSGKCLQQLFRSKAGAGGSVSHPVNCPLFVFRLAGEIPNEFCSGDALGYGVAKELGCPSRSVAIAIADVGSVQKVAKLWRVVRLIEDMNIGIAYGMLDSTDQKVIQQRGQLIPVQRMNANTKNGNSFGGSRCVHMQ